MHLIGFLLCLFITLMTFKEGQDIPSMTACSGVNKTSRDIFPWLWLRSENPVDKALLATESSVRSKFPGIRVFILYCRAPYPISFAMNSGFKNGEHPNRIEMAAITRYHEGVDFIASILIVISPQEEFRLKVSCIPICDLNRFPSTVDIFTEVDHLKKMSKLLVQNVSLVKALDYSKSEDGNQGQTGRFIFFTTFSRVVTILLMTNVLNFMLHREGFWDPENF